MTPKDKAKELVEKFKNRSIELGNTHSQLMAEANALIAVDEMTKYNQNIYHNDMIKDKYWNEVKKEIKNL